MTTDKDALQKIFEAALKESESPQSPRVGRRPQQATPADMGRKIDTAFATPPPRRPIKRERTETVMPVATKKPRREKVLAAVTMAKPSTVVDGPVLDDAASDELAKLLDEKMTADRLRHKRQRLVTLVVALGLIGGGSAWFASSPDRVQALTSAIKEVRSVTDVKGLVASYQESLDKVSSRSQQIDQATAAMGASTELKEGEDAYMEAEMQAMMGGEGKTTGARARAMEKTFGDRTNEAGGIIKPSKSISEKDSFSF